MATLYTVGPATFGATAINQVTGSDYNAGLEAVLLAADGSVSPTFVAVGQQAPRITMETTKVGTVLTAIAAAGSTISSPSALFSTTLRKRVAGGRLSVTTDNVSLSCTDGIIVPRRLSIPHVPPASLSFEVIPITSNQANAPITLAVNAAAPTPDDVSEIYCVGDVDLGATEIDGVMDIEIDFGIAERVLMSDGNVWPSQVCIVRQAPTAVIRTTNADLVNTLTVQGTQKTTCTIVLQAVARGGLRSGTDKTITIPDAHCVVRSIGNGDDSMTEIVLTGVYDGTNAVISIA